MCCANPRHSHIRADIHGSGPFREGHLSTATRSPRAVAASVLAIVSLSGTPLLAQGISLSPTIGVYVPTQELISSASAGAIPKQEISITVGGRLGIWFGSRVGLEGSADYAPSRLKFSATGQSQQDANVLSGSGKLTIYLLPEKGPVSFRITGGVGVVSRSGTAYANVADKTDIGGTGGAALGLRLGPLLSVVVGAEDYVYKPNFTGGLVNGLEQMQHDIHLSLGIGIPLLGLGTTKRH
jgi:hypothetical protein